MIDACAAPGNKTTQLAAMVGRTGEVCAFERNEMRFRTLQRQAARAGAAHVRCCHADFLAAEPAEYRGFTMALCDPSCSGSGGGGGHHQAAEAPLEYRRRLQSLAADQLAVVCKAMAMPDMRTVVYSTCSVHREENEDVVQAALDATASQGWTLARVLPDWPARGLASTTCGPLCARAGHEESTNGFFVARFERSLAPVPAKGAAKGAVASRPVAGAAVPRSQEEPASRELLEKGGLKKRKRAASAPLVEPTPPQPEAKPQRASWTTPEPEEQAAERKAQKRRRKDESRKKRKQKQQAVK